MTVRLRHSFIVVVKKTIDDIDDSSPQAFFHLDLNLKKLEVT